MCDIILLVYDQLEYTQGCIKSLIKNTDQPYRLIIVDNGSVQTQTVAYLDSVRAQYPDRVQIIRNEKNQGYVKAVNRGLAAAQAEFVCVISNDTVVYPGWLSEMLRAARADAAIGIVNPQWELPKGFRGNRDEYARRIAAGHAGEYTETDWARGFCFLVRRQVIEKIGGLDLAFAPAYYDDWDYSLRAIRAGFICVRALASFVWHYRNVTYGLEYPEKTMNAVLREKGALFHRRWGMPLRILVVADTDAGAKVSWLRNFIVGLLRGQNHVEAISCVRSLGIRHTNVRISFAPSPVIIFSALFALIDNMRHNRTKRFDVVFCTPAGVRFFKSAPFLKNTYCFRDLDVSGEGSRRLIQELQELQKRKFQTSPAEVNT